MYICSVLFNETFKGRSCSWRKNNNICFLYQTALAAHRSVQGEKGEASLHMGKWLGGPCHTLDRHVQLSAGRGQKRATCKLVCTVGIPQ